MDLIDDPPKFEVRDAGWYIYSRNTALAPQYVGKNARIINSTVSQGCMIDGIIEHSVIFSNVEVGEGSRLSDCVVMPDVKIGKNVTAQKAVIGAGAIIEDGAVIGVSEDPDDENISGMCTNGLVLIEGGATIGKNANIVKGAMIELK